MPSISSGHIKSKIFKIKNKKGGEKAYSMVKLFHSLNGRG